MMITNCCRAYCLFFLVSFAVEQFHTRSVGIQLSTCSRSSVLVVAQQQEPQGARRRNQQHLGLEVGETWTRQPLRGTVREIGMDGPKKNTTLQVITVLSSNDQQQQEQEPPQMTTTPTTPHPNSTAASNGSVKKGGGDNDDCFLCHFFPFLKAILPGYRNNVMDEVPRGAMESRSLTAGQQRREDEDDEEDDSQPKRMITTKDLIQSDYRAFIFCVHPHHGYMLLHCTRKKKKPSHFQLPGGHVDALEFEEAAKVHPDNVTEQLLLAGQMAAARELYEETGLDVRTIATGLKRLQPTRIVPSLQQQEEKKKKKQSVGLDNEYKTRLFYTLHLTDEDFLKEEQVSAAEAAFLQKAMGAQPPNLKVSLITAEVHWRGSIV
jgi:8-oxo-dGTP pyrophosphatase MutT (NUDIX family)